MSQGIREVFNLVLGYEKTLPLGVSSQHWQLKDMLKLKEKNLIYPRTCNIISFDTIENSTMPVLEDIDFFPTALFVKDEFLIVGGSRGNLKVKNLSSGETISSSVSNSINNNIFMHNNKIYICNNDRTLKTVSLDLKTISSINHIAQVNSCAVSPDGKYLVVVGDSNDVFLYSIEGDDHRPIKKLKLMEDGGFSVSWNSMSTNFAVGTQDGYCFIWDIRNDEPISKIESKQIDSHRGAIRNVKFSTKNSLDVLFFTEHFSYINVCDTRDFTRCQRIKVFPEKQITGAVFSNENDKIYVSTDDNVKELSINCKSRRMFPGL